MGEGNVDLGITGKDMVAESGVGPLITELLPLGFGKCSLQVQVPEHGPIQSVEQLCGRKVVTSFDCLAEQYFRELDQKVLSADERKAGKKTTIEYVGGSVEAACALGLADGIVDLVESGETMRAAGLHAIETILRSEAILIRSSRPASPVHAPLVDRIASRIAGVVAAGKYVMCQYNIERKRLDEGTAITPGRRAATVSPLDDSDWVAVSSMVIKSESADIMDRLQAIGASDILLLGLVRLFPLSVPSFEATDAQSQANCRV